MSDAGSLSLRELDEILRSAAYPAALPVSRAREYHLYSAAGRRYLDCILASGTAALGHNPPGLNQAIKNRLSSGPAAAVPTTGGGKLRQAVRRLFGSVHRAAPVSLARAQATLDGDTPVWRPFGEGPPAAPPAAPAAPAEAFLIYPTLPLAPELLIYCESSPADPYDLAAAAAAPAPDPAGVEAAGLTSAATLAAAAATGQARAPEDELVSPVILAGVTRALNLLASAYQGRPLPRKLASGESDGWAQPLGEGGAWERRGIYYRYSGREEDYTQLEEVLRESGILIPRTPVVPVTLPRIITAHERSLWERIHSTL